MLISKFKKNHLIINLTRNSSTSTKRPPKPAPDLLLDSFLNPPPITPTTNLQAGPSDLCSGHHSVSDSLSEFQSSRVIFSTAQVMNRAIQRLAFDSSSPQPPIPSSSSVPTHPIQSVQPSRSWNQIYIQFLSASSGPKEFANRIGDLVKRRLPRRAVDEIFRFHSSQTSLVSVDSYNRLIEYSYKSEKYHHARSLINEMTERGIEKNQATLELIACSYQALNKSKGVQLTLDAITSDGRQLSNECLTSLFAIRPRRASRLRHYDSMDDPGRSHPSAAEPSDQSTPSASDPGDPRWMPIEEFFKSHAGNLENIRTDGRALVTITKRFMESGRWIQARQFVHLVLSLDLQISQRQKCRLAINSYWSTSLLEALVFGLYNLKRQKATMKAKNETQTDIEGSTISRTELEEEKSNEDHCKKNEYLNELDISSVFEFVESFVDQHRVHRMKLNTKILLNCLRIQTSLPPTKIKSLIEHWTNHYGLDPNLMGSRLGVRLLHVFSAWFISHIRSIHALLHHPSISASGSSPDSNILVRAKIHKLIQEYVTINQDFVKCLKEKTDPDSRQDDNDDEDHHHHEGKDDFKMVERMIMNGPIDGKFLRSNYRFMSIQDLKSIESSLKKVFQIQRKIRGVLKLYLDRQPTEVRLEGPSSLDLDRVLNPIRFSSCYSRLIEALNTHHPSQPRQTHHTPALSSPLRHSRTRTGGQSNDSPDSHIHPSHPLRSPSLNPPHRVRHFHHPQFQILDNLLICWSSENLNSLPLCLKPSPKLAPPS